MLCLWFSWDIQLLLDFLMVIMSIMCQALLYRVSQPISYIAVYNGRALTEAYEHINSPVQSPDLTVEAAVNWRESNKTCIDLVYVEQFPDTA